MKLYEIAQEHEKIFLEIEANEGELTEELSKKLDAIEIERTRKVESVVRYIRNQESVAEAARTESARLLSIAERYEKTAENLEGYLLNCVGSAYVQQTPLGKVSFRRSERCVVIDEALIPKKFWKTQAPKPDIAGAKKAEKLPAGFKLEEHFSLQLK